MLEKGSYVSWASHFIRYVDGKKYQGIRIRRLVEKSDIDAMNWILLGILNDIYNSVDSYSTAQQTWKRVQRLIARQQHTLGEGEYDVLFYFLTQNEPDQYYVTHPPSVLDHDDDYQGDILASEVKDTLSTAMMLLAHAITQHFLTPTNNRLRTSSNTRNQAYVQVGRVDIQGKSSSPTSVMREAITPEIVQSPEFEMQSFSESRCYDQLEGLNALVIKMAHLQPADNDSDVEPKLILSVSQIDMINGLLVNNDHKHRKHAKLGAIRPTLVDDQLDNNTIFDDPYVEDNSKQTKHVHDVHDQKFVDFESLIRNVQT
nr:hypothetical protein [Tanacetum cinerariifolium]